MTRRAVLLAHPAGHSLSPVMHNAAFAALGINARYEAWDVPPRELAQAVARLREDDVLGANVSVPHKTAVMDELDALTDRAEAVGAVNVIVRDGDRLLGDNQDAEGFMRSLAEADVSVTERKVALLGAGGAARAIAWVLLQVGVTELRIWNRTPARADELVASLKDRAKTASLLVARDVDQLAGCDLWIQTTTLGMRKGDLNPDTTPVPEAAWPDLLAGCRDAVAVDIVYRPRRTPFLDSAQRAGARTIDGTGMLLHQGAAAFETWTGKTAPLDVMRDALHAALEVDA